MRKTVISLLVLAGVLVPASAASAQPPPNDNEANATKITAIPFTDTIDTSEATASGPSFCDTNRASVFYTFRSATRVKVQLDTFGSGYDTVVAVYTRDRRGAHLLRNGCSDDRLGSWGGVRFWAEAGVRYIFRIAAYGRRGGELTVHLGEVPSGPLQFSLDITDGTVDPETGMATISGTMTCNRLSAASFEGILRQLREGLWVARGYIAHFEVCSPGDPVVWTIEDVDTETGVAFGPGPALVRQFYEWASDGWSSTYEEDVRTTIELVTAT